MTLPPSLSLSVYVRLWTRNVSVSFCSFVCVRATRTHASGKRWGGGAIATAARGSDVHTLFVRVGWWEGEGGLDGDAATALSSAHASVDLPAKEAQAVQKLVARSLC